MYILEEKDMSWEENVRKVVPYAAGEQPKKEKMIKLNTNECPYPPSPMVARAASLMDLGDLRLYPDYNAEILVESLAEYHDVKRENIFVGVGSDDVLAMAFLAFFDGDRPVLFPDVTYSFYDVWADLYRIPYKLCPLSEDWHMRKEDYFGENGGIIFPNPNAPTGVLESAAFVEDIVRENPDVVVIVDEAYIDFGGESVLPLINQYENLLVVQTFSKSRAMAGARIGAAFGSEKLIRYLDDVKFSINSYTMNLPAQVMGAEAVKDDVYFRDLVKRIVRTREYSKERLKDLGFTFTDSMANFIFATHSRIPAKQIYEALKGADIYVRYFNKPRIDDYLRITIGTDTEMESLFTFLEKYLSANGGNEN